MSGDPQRQRNHARAVALADVLVKEWRAEGCSDDEIVLKLRKELIGNPAEDGTIGIVRGLMQPRGPVKQALSYAGNQPKGGAARVDIDGLTKTQKAADAEREALRKATAPPENPNPHNMPNGGVIHR